MQNSITAYRRKAELPKKAVRTSSSKLCKAEISVEFVQVPFNIDWLSDGSEEEPCDQS
jgi:hypothetical protein